MALELMLGFTALCACLTVVDLPMLDTYPDPTLKTLRYPCLDNVYRGEDYSRYHVNSYGLVGPEPAPLSDSRIYRIAVFGDSFVEALQVRHEQKFTTLVQAALVPPSNRDRIEVWNFGHSADNTGNEYARWRASAAAVHFDFVIFTFNEADLLENTPSDARDKSGSFLIDNGSGVFQSERVPGLTGGPRFPAFNALLPRFHNFNALLRTRIDDYLASTRAKLAQQRIKMLGNGPLHQLEHEDAVIPSQITEREIENSFGQLRYAYQQIAATGNPVVLLALPTDAATPAGFGSHIPSSNQAYIELTRRLTKAKLSLVDPYPAIASDIAKGQDPYSDWDPFHHFNARGHRIVAGTVVEYIAQHPEFGLQVRNELAKSTSR